MGPKRRKNIKQEHSDTSGHEAQTRLKSVTLSPSPARGSYFWERSVEGVTCLRPTYLTQQEQFSKQPEIFTLRYMSSVKKRPTNRSARIKGLLNRFTHHRSGQGFFPPVAIFASCGHKTKKGNHRTREKTDRPRDMNKESKTVY